MCLEHLRGWSCAGRHGEYRESLQRDWARPKLGVILHFRELYEYSSSMQQMLFLHVFPLDILRPLSLGSLIETRCERLSICLRWQLVAYLAHIVFEFH